MLDDLVVLLGDTGQWTWSNLSSFGGQLRDTGNRVGAWAQRHKKKLIFVGVIGGTGFLFVKYAQYKLKQFQTEFLKQQEQLNAVRMKTYFESAQKSCNASVVGFVDHGLRAKLNEIVNIPSSQTVRQLESKQEKLEMWEKIKTGTFTRAVVTIYTAALLTLFVRVEVNILGRYLYMNTTVSPADGGDDPLPIEEPLGDFVKKEYLSYAEYIINQGLPELADFIHGKVQEEMTSWPVTGRYSSEHLSTLFGNIRARIEGTTQNRSTFYQYLLPKEEITKNSNIPEQLLYLLNETRDVTESEKFASIFSTTVAQSFGLLMDGLAATMKSSPQMENDVIVMPHIIPILRNQAGKLLDTSSDPNMLHLLFCSKELEHYSNYIFTSSYDQE